MINNKTFLISTIILFIAIVFISTFVITGFRPKLHKSFQLEIINVKIKK